MSDVALRIIPELANEILELRERVKELEATLEAMSKLLSVKEHKE